MTRFPAICLIVLSLAAPAAGQGPQRAFQYYVETHPILTLPNAAVLSTLDEESISMADLSFSKENGKLIPIEGSDDCWKAMARTESFKRVSERMSVHGNLSYTHFRGQDMGGQVLINPANSPINFLEEDYSARGVKKRESYSLTGDLGYSLSDIVSIGTRLGYTSADQVKYKDPRFQNIWMDMSVCPGVFFRVSDYFSIGAYLEYRQTLEKINAGLYGTVDHDYYMLTDLGGFYGPRERFEGDIGYISVSNERPLSNSCYGLSVQTVAGRGRQWTGLLTALWRDGYFGNRSSSSVVFCEFGGPEVSFKGTMLLPTDKNIHLFSVDASYGLLNNYSNSYKHETQIGMSDKIVYLGQTRILARNDINATFSYSFFGDTGGYLPKWELKAAANTFCRLQSTTIYPFSRDWTSISVNISVAAGHNLVQGKNIYSCHLSAGFFTGFGEPRADISDATGSSKLKSFDSYSDLQFEYETASRSKVGLELKYTRLVPGRFVPYIKLSDSFDSLLSDPQYLDGKTRNIAAITLGCNF